MTRNDNWPEIPGEAEYRAQEREDKRILDEIEALTAQPLTDAERFALESADQVEQSWRRRHGLEPTPSLLRSSAEIAEEGRRTRWPGATRTEYLRALDREDAARKAGRTYGGAA